MKYYTKARIQTATGTVESFDIHASSFTDACRQAVQIADKLARKTCFYVRVVEVCK